MSTTTIVQTKYDQLTRQSATQIIEACLDRGGLHLTAEDLVYLTLGKPATVADAVQYVIDLLNDDAPKGHYYYVTADSNLVLDVDGGDDDE